MSKHTKHQIADRLYKDTLAKVEKYHTGTKYIFWPGIFLILYTVVVSVHYS